jgi:hypothetical protein
MMVFVLGPFCKDRPSCEAPKPRPVSSPRWGFGFGGYRRKRGDPKAAPHAPRPLADQALVEPRGLQIAMITSRNVASSVNGNAWPSSLAISSVC